MSNGDELIELDLIDLDDYFEKSDFGQFIVRSSNEFSIVPSNIIISGKGFLRNELKKYRNMGYFFQYTLKK